MDEDAPNYRTIIQNPMDMATLLQRVDDGKYVTCKAFLEDFDLILTNAKKYNGDDYNGARIVSRAHELRDSVHGMLSQMDPSLVAFCDKIAVEGGPVSLPDDLQDSVLLQTPVVQATSVTRASARLRNLQPEVNLDQSYESLKRQKKHRDNCHTAEEVLQSQDSVPPKSSQDTEVDVYKHQPPLESSHTDGQQHQSPDHNSGYTSQDVTMSDGEISSKVDSIKQLLVKRTTDYGIPQLERVYTRIMKGVFETKNSFESKELKSSILNFLLAFAEDQPKF